MNKKNTSTEKNKNFVAFGTNLSVCRQLRPKTGSHYPVLKLSEKLTSTNYLTLRPIVIKSKKHNYGFLDLGQTMLNITGFTANDKKPLFHRTWDAYVTLLYTWDKVDLIRRKSVKALFLDHKKHIIGEFAIDQDRVEKKDMQVIADISRNIKANSVIIGQSFSGARIRPSNEEQRYGKKIKQMASQFDLHIDDLIILNNGSFYSYAENHQL